MEKKAILYFCRLVAVVMAIIIWCFTPEPAHSQAEPPGYEAYFGSLMINSGQDMLVHVAYVTPTLPSKRPSIEIQVTFFTGDGGDCTAEPSDLYPKETVTVSLRDTLRICTLPASTGRESYRVMVKASGSHSGAVVPTIQLADSDQPLPFVLYPIYLPWLHPQEGSQP